MKRLLVAVAVMMTFGVSFLYADNALACESTGTDEAVPCAAETPAIAPPAPDAQTLKTVEHTYGGETLTADGLSIGLIIASAVLPSTNGTITNIGLGGYLLAAPAVHLAHGNPGRALGSLGLRVALPVGLGVGGFYTGYLLAGGGKGCNGFQCYGTVVVGALLGLTGVVVGMAGAMAVDAGVLARERVLAPSPARTLSVAPYFEPTRQGANVGLSAAGTF
jgi:hypothetical protein